MFSQEVFVSIVHVVNLKWAYVKRIYRYFRDQLLQIECCCSSHLCFTTLKSHVLNVS